MQGEPKMRLTAYWTRQHFYLISDRRSVQHRQYCLRTTVHQCGCLSTRGFAVTGAPSGGRQEAEGRSGGIACAKDILELQYLTRFNVPDRPKSNFLPAMACNFTSWATPNTAGDAAANEKNQYAHGVPYDNTIVSSPGGQYPYWDRLTPSISQKRADVKA